MSEPNSNGNEERQVPESQYPSGMIAQLRLTDLGLDRDIGQNSLDDAYRWSTDCLIMVDAVELERKYFGKTPEDFQALMQIEIFKSLKQLKSLGDSWRSAMREEVKKQLLTEQEEQRRYEKALTETRNLRNIHSVADAQAQQQQQQQLDTDPPPESNTLVSRAPTREDLYNMIKFLERDKRELNVTIDDMQISIKSIESKIELLTKDVTT